MLRERFSLSSCGFKAFVCHFPLPGWIDVSLGVYIVYGWPIKPPLLLPAGVQAAPLSQVGTTTTRSQW